MADEKPGFMDRAKQAVDEGVESVKAWRKRKPKKGDAKDVKLGGGIAEQGRKGARILSDRSRRELEAVGE